MPQSLHDNALAYLSRNYHITPVGNLCGLSYSENDAEVSRAEFLVSLEIGLRRWNQNFFVSRPIFCLANLDRLIDPGTPTDLELDCRVRRSLCDGS